MNKIPIVAVLGPTASGKTELGVSIAKRFGGEVISADSMQIYEGMDIATAKPTASEMQGVPHHLIGFLPPCEAYSVARFQKDAASAVDSILSRGNLPVLVGGTGLYADAFLDNLRFFEQEENREVRARLEEECRVAGAKEMYRRLASLDPEGAAELHPNNTVRVLRALEVLETTGKTVREQTALSHSLPSPYRALKIGITFRDREKLYERIEKRVDRMLQAGLVDEARAFYEKAYSRTAHNAIGYKEMKPYLAGTASLEACSEKLKQETRRYAKRQLCWFRRDPGVNWFFRDDFQDTKAFFEAVGDTVSEFLKGEV